MREKERTRGGERERYGGTEIENKDWNINRFASVFTNRPTWHDLEARLSFSFSFFGLKFYILFYNKTGKKKGNKKARAPVF